MDILAEKMSLLAEYIEKGDKESVKKFFSVNTNKQLLNQLFPFYTDKNLTPLHVCALKNNSMISVLLELGADPRIANKDNKTAFHCLIDSRNFTMENLLLMIKHGADPNTQSEEGDTLLHLLASHPGKGKFIFKYLPMLLTVGANPDIENKEGKTALQLLLERENISYPTIDAALALVQHEKEKAQTDEKKKLYQVGETKKLFSIINENYFFPINKKIAFDEEKYNANDIAMLRIELKQSTQTHIAKNEFLTLLFLLARDRNNQTSKSYFSQLPLEIIFHILRFMDFDSMNKTTKESLLLAEKIFSDYENIKAMFKEPKGGINIIQYHVDNKNVKSPNEISFKFFHSAEVLAKDINNELKLTKKTKLFNFNFFRNCFKSEKVNVDQLTVRTNKTSDADRVLQNHLSIFKNGSNKKNRLINELVPTELYQCIGFKPEP